MALIVLPAIENSPYPQEDGVQQAEEAILNQIGGVGPKMDSGWKARARRGNLDVANFAANPGFTNQHKREPMTRCFVTAPTDAAGRTWLTAGGVGGDMHVDAIALTHRGAGTPAFKGEVRVHVQPGDTLLSVHTSESVQANSAGKLDAAALRLASWRFRAFLAAGTWIWAELVPDAGTTDVWVGDVELWGRSLHG